MSILNISIVIVTYKRPKHLHETLLSIMRQSFLPKEIIIVDNAGGMDKVTPRICSNLATEFRRIGILLSYSVSTINSLTVGRNLGVSKSTGDVVLFLDDDATLEPDYLEEIQACYSEHPDAIGVQGKVVTRNKAVSQFVNVTRKAFSLSHPMKNECSILRSGNDLYPYPVTETIECMRFSGISSYRRNVFKKLKFDEKMKSWAFLEDADFSYRLYKLGLGSLYLTPRARALHNETLRLSNRPRIFMMTIHRLYFFFKNMEPSLTNIFALGLSMVGNLVLMAIGLMEKRKLQVSGFNVSEKDLIYLISSYVYALRHFKEIRKLNLEPLHY